MNHVVRGPRFAVHNGTDNWNLEKVRKSQAAHGVSTFEAEDKGQAASREVVEPVLHGPAVLLPIPALKFPVLQLVML